MAKADQHTEQIAKIYDQLAANGPYGTLAPHNRGGRKSEYVASVFDHALLPLITKLGPEQSILDYGCGTGIFSRKVAAFAREVVGMDISAGMLEQAKLVCTGLGNVRLLLTDGRHTGLPDGFADVVVAREVLCYVPDDELTIVLSELRRVTRPGGRFFWLEQASRNPKWQRHPDAFGLVKRAPEDIYQAARASGWSIVNERIVRTPRFPWIYPVWFGLVPRRFIATLARWEVAIHMRDTSTRRPRRWWDGLFELQNPDDE